MPHFFFLLAAAWVCPGQWCQRRYGHSHRMMVFIIKMKQKHAQKGHLNNKTKQRTSQHCDFVAQLVKKRALVKSQQKAPTPEWENASSTCWSRGLWWNPVGKHLRQSGKVQCCKPTGRPKVGWVQKEHIKVSGQLWNASCSIRNSNAKEEIYLRGKPSSKLYLAKGETCETWNCTLLRVRSVYLGLAKRRQRRKRKKQPKRSPARQWQQRNSRSGAKLAAAKSPAQGQYPKIHKTNDKGGICKRQQGETWWIGSDRGNVN